MPQAILLPVDFTSPARFERELEQIFERAWVHVADVVDVAEPGAYAPAQIGRTPLLVVRVHDEVIRVFLNACPHRGATLAEAPGRCAERLRCPYHGWSFGADGTLQAVPFREEFDCDLAGRNLVAVRAAVLGPMIFACLDAEAPRFEDWAGDLVNAFARAGARRWEPAFEYDYTVRANWKAYVQNGLEGYHIPYVHDFLRDALELASGVNHLEPHGSYTLVDAAPEMAAVTGGAGQFRFGHLFPNLIPVFSPVDFSYLRIDPVDAGTIRLRGRGFDAGAETAVPREVRAAAFDATNRQDIAVVERVQRGLHARGLQPAVHSDLREARVTHFERLVADALQPQR